MSLTIDPRLQANLKKFLELQLADTAKGWWMEPNGNYVRSRKKDLPVLRFQDYYYEILQAEHRFSAAAGI
jgi:polyphosphate kinase